MKLHEKHKHRTEAICFYKIIDLVDLRRETLQKSDKIQNLPNVNKMGGI